MRKIERKPQQDFKNSLLRIRSLLIPVDDENRVMYLHAIVAIIGSLSAFFILDYGAMSLGIMEHSFLVLIEKTCVIVVIAYIISRTSFFQEILRGNLNIKNQFLMIISFGLISIFGTYSGITIFGAQANVRDIAPIIAGLIGGPIVGVGVGLIGGIERSFLGGFTVFPCSLTTVIAGLIGGLIFYFNGKKFIGIIGAVTLAAFMESLDMGLVLLITKPYSQAVLVVQNFTGPMILANALGILIFAFIIVNHLNEQKTKRERDEYLDELERHKFELKVAHKIQKSFLPDNIPQIGNLDLAALNLPAEDSGGDFYDFIPLSDDDVGVVIADVADRKIPATLLMALSRTIIRSKSMENPQAGELANYLNRLITEDSKSNVSLSLFYGILNLKNKDLTFINAGHSPPIFFKNITKEIMSLEKDDVFLGEKRKLKVNEKHVHLDKDDILVFHTYGVNSVINKYGENFKTDYITKILKENYSLSAEELISKLKESIKTFCKGMNLKDDISLIVLKIE